MNPSRDLDALVAEKVMGWRDDLEYAHSYSTDISAAWGVVEKMNSNSFDLNLYQLESSQEFFECTFTHMNVTDTPDASIERTAPHAICLAALKAIGWVEK